MAIRLNLLAESQALEEQRRRDPAKRAIWVGVMAVAALLAWSSTLQLRVIIAKSEVGRLEGEMKAKASEYALVMTNLQNLADVRHKLASLNMLATNRFLHGSVLNALQRTALDNVQLRRLRMEQSYAYVPAAKANPEGDQKAPAKPASVTEQIVVTLDAEDTSSTPGDNVGKFKQSIASSAHFQELLTKTNEVKLTSLSAPQNTPGRPPYVLFSLECRLPERIHL